MCRFVAVLLGTISLLGSHSFAVAAVRGEAQTEIGANKFDLLLQFTGRASGGDGSDAYRRIDRAMALKAILDARDAGFKFLRFAAAGYGPSWPDDPVHNDLARWLTDPTAYWADVDDMFDALDRARMRVVPSLLWNINQFPALTGETVTDLVTNPKSHSRDLATRYIADFIRRYRRRDTVLFYEIGNEFNLLADLDEVKHCSVKFGIRQYCDANGNFSTAALIAFSGDLVELIKRLDPSRGVSSGYSTPRSDAYHLSLRPEFSPDGPDWTPDSRAEFSDYMLKINAPFEFVSLHIYPGTNDLRPELGVTREANMVDVVAAIFHPVGKKVFVGEFGDKGGSQVIHDMLVKVKQKKADYVAVWAWEYYQSSTHPAFDSEESDYRIEPGQGDESLRAMITPSSGSEPPKARVVLTWPLPCAEIIAPVDMFAVASVGSSIADRVEFFLDGNLLGISNATPFQMTLNPGGLGPRLGKLQVRAYALNGSTSARFESPVSLNGYSGSCSVPR